MAVVLAAAPTPATGTGAEPMGRVQHVTADAAGDVRLWATFLTGARAPILLDDMLAVEVRRVSTSGLRDPVERFEDASPTRRTTSRLQSLAASGVPIDIVVVVTGNGDRDRSGAMNAALREAALVVLEQLPDSSHANLLWVGDTVSFFADRKGKAGELSDWWSAQPWCAEADVAWLGALARDGAATAIHPCGLHADRTSMIDAIRQSSATTTFEGVYPALFGLPWVLCGDERSEPHRLEELLRADDQGASLRRLRTSAIDIAVRLLARFARPGSMRAVVVLGDGKDGYLLAEGGCRAEAARRCAEADAAARGPDCLRRELNRTFFGPRRQLFADKARRLLPALRAVGARLDAVLLPTSDADEVERMMLLAHKSGGTFRHADEDGAILPQAEASVSELTEALVIDVRLDEGAGDRPDDDIVLEVTCEVPTTGGGRRSLVAAPVRVRPPAPARGPAAMAARAHEALVRRFGPRTARVIAMVVLGVLAALALGLVVKLGGKLIGALRKRAKA